MLSPGPEFVCQIKRPPLSLTKFSHSDPKLRLDSIGSLEKYFNIVHLTMVVGSAPSTFYKRAGGALKLKDGSSQKLTRFRKLWTESVTIFVKQTALLLDGDDLTGLRWSLFASDTHEPLIRKLKMVMV